MSDGELCLKKCSVYFFQIFKGSVPLVWPPSCIYIYVFHRIFLGIIIGSISTKNTHS